LTALSPWQAIILGLVEGITEFLPVSSTGHLILVSWLLGLDDPETKKSIDAFNIVIQGGAILAVLGLYFQRVKMMLRGVIGRDRNGLRLAINIVIAFVPAAVVGVLLKDEIEQRLFFPVPVISALSIGGLVMIVVGRWQRQFFRGDEHADPADAHSFVDIEHLTWRRAFIVGILQCLALWPGTSRSMVTIVGGMAVGMRPRQAAEFSFLLGVPTLGGACIYSMLKNLAGEEPNMFEILGWPQIALGVLVASISAALAITWLVSFLSKHGLAVFGWYRLALSAALAILVWRGLISFGGSN
jgi:undecaprenyl-diphosphatase